MKKKRSIKKPPNNTPKKEKKKKNTNNPPRSVSAATFRRKLQGKPIRSFDQAKGQAKGGWGTLTEKLEDIQGSMAKKRRKSFLPGTMSPR